MLTYEEMQYLVAFSRIGTLSGVARGFHISQPSVSRAMQKAEEVFGVPLFDRKRNHIQLNGSGELAAKRIEKILAEIDDLIRTIKAFSKSAS
ncbi:LysR family transcriptional regulator [Catenisphaera adipataccumulans]|uniref:DNA-binding transcriptional LysR family regulator n=1 Tax=Catenisphaera adipataccumulans TaxID=700500 RepID=A0A7W8CWZ7_9FIRM|nr:LysR family transcriptional regulator [Catenisphaera adipataccumulans]MBB5183133.1 DNA-binding transcriptional LysR family regulator [Catenisphaera adipataccumulans]